MYTEEEPVDQEVLDLVDLLDSIIYGDGDLEYLVDDDTLEPLDFNEL